MEESNLKESKRIHKVYESHQIDGQINFVARFFRSQEYFSVIIRVGYNPSVAQFANSTCQINWPMSLANVTGIDSLATTHWQRLTG